MLLFKHFSKNSKLDKSVLFLHHKMLNRSLDVVYSIVRNYMNLFKI